MESKRKACLFVLQIGFYIMHKKMGGTKKDYHLCINDYAFVYGIVRGEGWSICETAKYNINCR